MSTHPVRGNGHVAGLVGQARLLDSEGSEAAERGGTSVRILLPGLVGPGPLWRRACDEVESVCTSGEWVALEGEPGVGKRALLRAIHQRRRPGHRLAEVDLAATRGKGWLDDICRPLLEVGNDVLLTHVDQLDGVRLRALSSVLQQVRGSDELAGDWVAITLGPGPKRAELLRLLEYLPRTVEVPPLRHHVEDVQLLVPFLLSRLGYGGRLTCSAEVEQQLSRSSWPGNVAQVLQVLRNVVQHRRSGVIALDDLPPELLTVSRRRLSQLEAIERDAIVRGLLDANDNKAEAALALGMSRATIYRKIHEYGIVPPRGTAPASSTRQRAPTSRSGSRKRSRPTDGN